MLDQVNGDGEKNSKVELHIPMATFGKVLGLALVVYGTIVLSPLFMTLFLAVMLAVTLYPLLEYLRRRKLPSWVGVTIVVGGFLATTMVFFVVVLPPLLAQTGAIIGNLPALRQSLLDQVTSNPSIHSMAEKAVGAIAAPDATKLLAPLVSVGAVAASGVAQLLLVMIFTVYLLVDGPRTTRWILAFFGSERRAKLTATTDEISKVVSAYVAGQIITSLICGVYTFAVLLLLKVPAALPLAFLAGVFDVLPVLGFFLAAIPAVLLALTVSPVTALLVVALYVAYHGVENYFLVPKIYGSRLRLSDLVVLVSLLAAGSVAGVLGAISVLPLVASYPIIERIWLVGYLGRGVVSKHGAAAAEADNKAPQS